MQWLSLNELGWFWKEPLVSTRHFDQYALIVFCFLQKTIRAYWLKRWVETNGSFQNHPDSSRDYYYMVLPQTFLYRISTITWTTCMFLVFLFPDRQSWPQQSSNLYPFYFPIQIYKVMIPKPTCCVLINVINPHTANSWIYANEANLFFFHL